MEQGKSRRIYTGTRVLTGQVEDYREPVRAVLFEIQLLLNEYSAKGGDLNDVQLTTSLERTPGRTSRPHLRVDLRGYGWTGGSTANDANGTSSETTTS